MGENLPEMNTEREEVVVFDPILVDEQELERQRDFEEYLDYLRSQMIVKLTVPAEFYRNKG